MPRKYKRLAVVGEWDRFHNGHRTLIRKALELSDKITLIIYEFTLAHSEAEAYVDLIEAYDKRAYNVKTFIKKLGYEDRVTYVEHIKGEPDLLKSPAILDVETIIISKKDLQNVCMQDTITKGIKIRKDLGIDTKPPETIETVKDESGAIISSSKLRKREWLKMKRHGDS